MRDYRVYLKLVDLVRIYKPTVNLLHYIVYLYAFKYGLFWEATDWEWEFFGENDVIYSPTLQKFIELLVRAGKLKLCKCNILCTSVCPEIRDCDEYVMRYSKIMLDAVEHASRRVDLDENITVLR